MPGEGQGLSVEQLIVEFIVPRLDSIERKLDGKADMALVQSLELRVGSLELHGSRGAQDLAQQVARNAQRLEGVEAWRNRIVGAEAVIGVMASGAMTIGLKLLLGG